MLINYRNDVKGKDELKPDAVAGNTAFHILTEPKDSRRIRSFIMDIARISVIGKFSRSVLIVNNPRITLARMKDEWTVAATVIRAEIFNQMVLIIHHLGNWTTLSGSNISEDIPLFAEILKNVSSQGTGYKRRSSAFFDIFRILLNQWLLKKGPTAINKLMEISGKSHPTVLRSLKSLDYFLIRHSNRQVELKQFPKLFWERLVAMSDIERSTIVFTDKSKKPRSPQFIIDRIKSLNRNDIALGGVVGANFYCPELDIVGVPRLDITIHSPNREIDFSFIKRIDPALQLSKLPNEHASFVIHSIHRPASLFHFDEKLNFSIADPVECLLDLHEARLEPQALEFLNQFRRVF